ncbi:hypothetical protein CB1_000594018 [Camelus ferus]|nr:hypothetical protein CB1_000594018 [Camelus ferus]
MVGDGDLKGGGALTPATVMTALLGLKLNLSLAPVYTLTGFASLLLGGSRQLGSSHIGSRSITVEVPTTSDTEVYSEFYPVPPPYSVATSLPTYDEAEKAKAAAMAAAAAEASQRVRHCHGFRENSTVLIDMNI